MPPLSSSRGICSHGKRAFYCKECPGKGICSHGKRIYRCKECPGKGICSHGKSKYRCKECSKKEIKVPGELGRQRWAFGAVGVPAEDDDVFYLCGEQAAAEAPIEIAKTGNAEQAENVARTAPACNIHDALSACESRACWGDLKQHSPPSFLQEPLPQSKMPPPPPPSFRPLQQIDAEDAPPRAWLALLLHAD